MRELLLKLGLFAASLLLALGLCEVALRLRVGPPVIWLYPQERYVPDAEIGYRLAPGQRAFTHDEPFETNSQGIRAPEVPRDPLPGVRRLLAFGDSQTAGDGLALADTWPAQLADELATRRGARDGESARLWEVLNAGLSGANPWHYARLLPQLANAYRFDGVVVALYVNDVTPDPPVPGVNVVTNTRAHRVVYRLKRSALFTALWQARVPLVQALWPGPEVGREERVLTGEFDEQLERGWHDIEADLQQIRDLAREHGAETWLLLLPRRDQVQGRQTGRTYNRRAAEMAGRLGLPLVDVLDALSEAYNHEGDALFIPWDGHNSRAANRVIARELAATILATLKLPGSGEAAWFPPSHDVLDQTCRIVAAS